MRESEKERESVIGAEEEEDGGWRRSGKLEVSAKHKNPTLMMWGKRNIFDAHAAGTFVSEVQPRAVWGDGFFLP